MNATPDLHMVIATGQNLANLIPALQCAAREVWILQTPAMRDNRSAVHLAAALAARGVAVQRIDFADDDVTTLHAQAEAVARRVGGRPVTINFTGGTKPMTLALVQTLAADLATTPGAEEPHLVYCDTTHRRLDWLSPHPRSEPMRSVLKIDDILLAQGYRRQAGSGGAATAEWQRAARQRAALTRWLGEQSASIGRFFGTLNALAARALPHQQHNSRFQPVQALDFAPGGHAAEALRRARDAGVVSWQGDREIAFVDESAAEYLRGGWVEEFAGLKLSGTRADGGWAPRLCIEHVDSGARNELDGVLVHGNRMLVIECKSARGGDDKASDWVYKLAQLARVVGGLMAQPLLLSARELSTVDVARASEYCVDVLAAADLRTLPDYLRRWMAG